MTVLAGAFFSPLHVNDWLAYRFGQPALIGLEDDEAFDVFVRAAVVGETVHPELAEGRQPLAWVAAAEDPRPILAHVLADLQQDRPMLFHRVLRSLVAVSGRELDPEGFELVEDFLLEALNETPLDLEEAVADEVAVLARRGLLAAGPGSKGRRAAVAEAATQVLARPGAAEAATDEELLYWLGQGEGLAGIAPKLAPAVMVEVWRRWVSALVGIKEDLDLLARLTPDLAVSSDDLALLAPPDRNQPHVLLAECPYCGAQSQVEVGPKVREVARCEHLLFMGTTDEVHLWEVVSRFDVGEDFKRLMATYYQSPPDLELFCTLTNDLFEMFREQGRLRITEVSSEEAPRAFYYLRAFYAGPPATEEAVH